MAQASSRTTKKTTSARSGQKTSQSSGGSSGKSQPNGRQAKPGLKAKDVARAAAAQLSELTGREPETVIGIRRDDEGWMVELEVVESRRIPDSADILANYEVQLDDETDIVGYRRTARYNRGTGTGERR